MAAGIGSAARRHGDEEGRACKMTSSDVDRGRGLAGPQLGGVPDRRQGLEEAAQPRSMGDEEGMGRQGRSRREGAESGEDRRWWGSPGGAASMSPAWESEDPSPGMPDPSR
ncbi:hypothetical protein BS78_K236500 [Paspalum vaginatum]|uniref:Uncharacterized protein n=1 Tax=Paspalum vaginatum TaxID=158149 RepID=A0A9W7X745_9POAL|nr:hypothetical protein BS78_K236500 [Paspalum vaginatum]